RIIIETPTSSLQGVIANVHPGDYVFRAPVTSFLLTGDSFDLPFMRFSSSGTVTLDAGNQLHVVENGSTFTIALDPKQNFAHDIFQLSTDSGTGSLITDLDARANICFCRGTRILTERGEV